MLLKAHARARQPDGALAVLGEMHAAGFPPGPVTLAAALGCLASCGRLAEARAMLDAVRAQGKGSDSAFAQVAAGHVAAGDAPGLALVLRAAHADGLAGAPAVRGGLEKALQGAGLAQPAAAAAAGRMLAQARGAAPAAAATTAREGAAGRRAPAAPPSSAFVAEVTPRGASRLAENARAIALAAVKRATREAGAAGWAASAAAGSHARSVGGAPSTTAAAARPAGGWRGAGRARAAPRLRPAIARPLLVRVW